MTPTVDTEVRTTPAEPAIQMPERGWVPPVALEDGPEMAALRRFNFNCTWTGTVEANGMGPGSPAMSATGRATFTPIMNGAWLVGEFAQDQRVDETTIIHWQSHFVVGWDPRAGEYRVTFVDNTGNAGLMRGWIMGNCFIVEPLDQAPMQLRMIWEQVGDGIVRWTNEGSVNGGPWFLIESYLCTATPAKA